MSHIPVQDDLDVCTSREGNALNVMRSLGLISEEDAQDFSKRLIDYEAVEAKNPNDLYWFEEPEAVALEPTEPTMKAKWDIFLNLSRWRREDDGSLGSYQSGLRDAIQLSRLIEKV